MRERERGKGEGGEERTVSPRSVIATGLNRCGHTWFQRPFLTDEAEQLGELSVLKKMTSVKNEKIF